MAQSRGFPVKRPAGFHWDFFLLGCTTFISGVIGLPAPNGLVPQAPVHTESLSETHLIPAETEVSEGGFFEGDVKEARAHGERRIEQGAERSPMKVVRTRVVEQRVSHFAMGVRPPSPLLCSLSHPALARDADPLLHIAMQLLILGTMSRPLLVVLYVLAPSSCCARSPS